MNYYTLRDHFETYFNRNLQHIQPTNPNSDLHRLAELHKPTKTLPSETEYWQRFSGGSSSYLNLARRTYRRQENYKLLRANKIRPEEIVVRGEQICTGFSYGGQAFACADSIPLILDTIMLIFVPSLFLYTVASTCDYCIHIMSSISRYLAYPPLPMHFLPKLGKPRRRIGIGSSIDDHASFLRVIQAEGGLTISPTAQRYADIKESAPQTIFIVDFEIVWRLQRNLPLCPTEVTVRDGNNDIIISCTINDEGVTNAQFETDLKNLGYTDDGKTF